MATATAHTPTVKPLRLSSPAKINLSLRILGRRDDGFHALETRMCPLALADEVAIAPLASGPNILTCSDPGIPVDESNLALRAVRAFEARSGKSGSWSIHLEKRIPAGAGLGGGSSNAATVLLGLNELTGFPLDAEALHSAAAELGSDVPFFLHRTTCDARGRGEAVTPVTDWSWQLPLVLIKPSFSIPTPWAYGEWANSKEIEGVLYAPQICPWGAMQNDLERPVFSKWILLPTLKEWLLDQGETRAALMSGSGSTMFAITNSPSETQSLAERARALCGESTWVVATHTL